MSDRQKIEALRYALEVGVDYLGAMGLGKTAITKLLQNALALTEQGETI